MLDFDTEVLLYTELFYFPGVAGQPGTPGTADHPGTPPIPPVLPRPEESCL